MLGPMEGSPALDRSLPADAHILSFWGKARPESDRGPRFHPIAYHLLDVAAVAEELLRNRRLIVQRLTRLLGLAEEDTRALIVALAALHDLGKFAPAFQAKAPEHWPVAALGPFPKEQAPIGRRHTEDGFVLWDERLAERLSSRVWTNGEDALRTLAPAVFGHHGRPVGSGFARDPLRARFRNGLSAAEQCAETVLSLLLLHPVTSVGQPADAEVELASWLVSGLLTTADWIGSREGWFPYAEPDPADAALAKYLERARALAKVAVRKAGLVPSQPSPERSFTEVARVPGSPTPLQRWASEVALPSGPSLFLIEDVTGSGKTEAAQMLVHRLISAGHASGAYWAMPTMATANAMYARQARAIRALYIRDDAAWPSLVLAHGQQALHEAFRSTVLRVDTPSDDRVPDAAIGSDDDDELDSSVACAAFLADDRRVALLADVGVGTVDQAILGVLPSRFNTMRLLGLSEKVLIIDEAHAYDAYMGVEIQELLRFHAAFGGSAVVLSATLSARQRRSIAEAWADGVAGGGRLVTFGGGLASVSSEYPLATAVSAVGLHEEKLEAAPWSHRSVGVRLVHDLEGAISHVLDAQSRGGAVAWVRNTVDDCLDAAARLRDRGADVLVFHARFAQGDRQEREGEVMRLFGREARAEDRRGRVLVATQVIEQSLDLDFDAMVSDVAPIDLLVQRAGRLWRHTEWRAAERPSGLSTELVVFSPVPSNEPPADWLGGPFAGTAHVYDNVGVLWRTVRALTDVGRIETPRGSRSLIERVYDSEDVPDSLVRATQGAEGKASAHAATANFGVLKARDGYHADAVAWASDIRMPTRLGDLRTTVRLARVGSDDILEPWVSVSGPAWKSWALSEVSVSAYRIPLGSTSEARFMDRVTQLREGWGQFEREIPLVVFEPVSTTKWTGTSISPRGVATRLEYTLEHGLDFSALGS
jgi:CRISPR-associated endonuclease/helicase Cas3